jgi:hypothetical protein
MKKSMIFIADMANQLASIRGLQSRYQREQVAEGDTGSGKIVGAIHDWLASGIKLLEDIVADEVSEFSAGKDVEQVWDYANGSYGPDTVLLSAPSDWMKALAGVMRARRDKAKVPAETRKLRKTVADQLEKAATAMALSTQQAKPDPNGAGSGGNARIDTATKVDERAEKLLRGMVAQIGPMVKAAQDTRVLVADLTVKNAALEARLAKIEAQPVVQPLRKAAVGGLRLVEKRDDAGADSTLAAVSEIPADASPFLKRMMAIPAGSERNRALLREAYSKD